MTFQAFGGNPATKIEMIEPVLAQWNARALVPDANFQWESAEHPNSISGALAKTRDRSEFEQRTGIPADLALLCELLLATGVRKSETQDKSTGFSLEADDAVFAFGTEWLDAIRPGANLSMVVPQFARHCLDRLLKPDFDLATHVSSDIRDAGCEILSLWDRELAGENTTRRDWRGIQRAAMLAAANDTDPWGYRVGAFIEAIAWPVRSVAREFVGLFDPFLFNWLMYLETPFMTDEEKMDRAHMLLGWKAMATAPRDEAGHIDFDPLESLPESVRVISSEYIMRTMDRTIAVRESAQADKNAVIRDLMVTLLGLIRSA
jgi:hypothetical protein